MEQQKNYVLGQPSSANSHKTEVCFPCPHSPGYFLIPDYPSQSAAAGTDGTWQHPAGARSTSWLVLTPSQGQRHSWAHKTPVTSEQHRSVPGRAFPAPPHVPTKPKPRSAKGVLPPQKGKGTIDSSLRTWQAMWELIQPGWASWSQENNFGS